VFEKPVTLEYFRPGVEIELREVWDGRTWEIRRGVVVRDNAEVVAVFTAGSTPAVVATDEAGSRLRLPPEEWRMNRVLVPRNRNFLAVHPTGADHSTILIWDDNWQLRCWYINLESPLVRTPAGFEYRDHFLDVVVAPDLSGWKWKDEDELAEAVHRRLVTAAEATRFRAEGERAIEDLLARKPPYDEPWENWRPGAVA
jgi:predicted RNA-binding protein associated with RNAse of E/G family